MEKQCSCFLIFEAVRRTFNDLSLKSNLHINLRTTMLLFPRNIVNLYCKLGWRISCFYTTLNPV